jgi:hypothetical protein
MRWKHAEYRRHKNGTGRCVDAINPLSSKVRALTVNGGATQGTIQAVISVTYTYA